MQFNEEQRSSTQIYEGARNFTKTHENYGRLQQVPSRPRNCRQRSASHFANWAYIAGYAPSCLFRAGLNRAWTSVAMGLKSNDLRPGEKLAEKTGAFQKKRPLTHKTFRREGGWRGCKNSAGHWLPVV
jgi:hypothetical protein